MLSGIGRARVVSNARHWAWYDDGLDVLVGENARNSVPRGSHIWREGRAIFLDGNSSGDRELGRTVDTRRPARRTTSHAKDATRSGSTAMAGAIASTSYSAANEWCASADAACKQGDTHGPSDLFIRWYNLI